MRYLLLFLPLLLLLSCQPSGDSSTSAAGDTSAIADRTKIVDFNPDKDPRALSEMIQIDGIGAGAAISSPFTLTGKAIGEWYFEGDFPVMLKDMEGNILSTVPARAQTGWMDPGFVPFRAEVIFIAGPGTPALLVLEKDNPGEEGEGTARAVEIPVVLR